VKKTIGLNPSIKKYSSYCFYNGKIYLFGGVTISRDYGEYLLTNELYELSIYGNEGIWRIVKQNGDIPSTRFHHGCCVLDDHM
jgi:hypothetical protein